MDMGSLGRDYQDGEIIVRQGDEGNCMFVIQDGQAEVILERDCGETRLNLLRKGDLFGEMSIFEGKPRSATVRALGRVRVLSVDKKNFLKRVHEDPSLAYRLVQTLSRRVRDLDELVGRSGGTVA